ncbi:class I SAM-dependent methyltransferase [Rhodocaloribacter sp.]
MLYEDQAERFDARAGLPPGAEERIAEALADVVRLAPGQTLLEVGAGTGALSLPLVRLPIRYVGFDRSPAMLAVFRRRLEAEGLRAELHVADGNERWPAPDGSVSVIFSARALHHLAAAHVVAEVRRVARAGGAWLAVGRVRRPRDSTPAVMRRELRRLLRRHGFEGAHHEAHTEAVFARLERSGGRRAPARTAARWSARHSPADALTAWTQKAGLAGLELPPDVKAHILAELRSWAETRFGDPDEPRAHEEFFEIETIFFEPEV